jgi:glycosyltransferase involved in cell wall biosynthesis
MAGFLTGTPVVATFHGMVDVSRRERMIMLKRMVMRLGTSRFVAVSRSLARSLAADGLVGDNDCSIVFNEIDTARFNRERNGWLHRQLGLEPHAKIVASIGNIRPAKGYDVVCRAAAILRQTHPDLHFVIAGDLNRSFMEAMTGLTQELGVQDRAHFIGFVSDSASVLAEADFFLLSSTTEGFSIATLEALASSLPCILTACGGPEEIPTPEEHALMVPPGDASALANAITRLANDRVLPNRLAKAGLDLAQARFDIRTMLSNYAALYTGLLFK